MVTLNSMLKDTIENLFYNSYSSKINYGIGNWEDNNVLSRLISCDLKGPELEIPLCIKYYVEKAIQSYHSQSLSSLDDVTVVIPILKDPFITNKRTADSILRSLLSTQVSTGMCNVTTNKGLEYHGNTGYILDDDYNMIMFITILGKYVINEDGYVTGFKYTGSNIYVSPKILTSTDIISKNILKKILPFMLQGSPFTVKCPSLFGCDSFRVKVIIEDRNDFFIIPNMIDPNTMNESINSFLNIDNNIDNILYQLYKDDIKRIF